MYKEDPVKELREEKKEKIKTFDNELTLFYNTRGCVPIFPVFKIFRDSKIIYMEGDNKFISYLTNVQKNQLEIFLSNRILHNQNSCADYAMIDGGSSELVFRYQDSIYCIIKVNCWDKNDFSQEYHDFIDFLNELIEYTKEPIQKVFV